MKYSKPEVSELGNAARLIQGSKLVIPEGSNQNEAGPSADCELDD